MSERMMTNSVVIFSHGKESGPWGTKIKALASVAASLGCGVESVDYTGLPDPDERVARLLDQASRHDNATTILVGSSMGGYVATLASETIRPAGLFLIAPAFYLPGYACRNPRPCSGKTVIVHGWFDDVVPPTNSIRFAAEHQAELHLLRGDHQLIDNLPAIEKLFAQFLQSLPAATP